VLPQIMETFSISRVINSIAHMLNIPCEIESYDHDDDDIDDGTYYSTNRSSRDSNDDSAILFSINYKKRKEIDGILNKAIQKINNMTMFGAENDRCSLSICSSEGGSLYSCDCYSSTFDDLDGYLGIDENTKVDYNSSMAQLY